MLILPILAAIYEFYYNTSGNKLLLHDRVNLTCVVPTFALGISVNFILKNDQGRDVVIPSSKSKHILSDQKIVEYGDTARTLTILDYSYEQDNGDYSCIVNITGCSKVGEKKLRIVGYRGPVITEFRLSSSIFIGSEVNLTCFYYATNYDEPLVHFRKRNHTNGTVVSINEIRNKYQYQQPIYHNGSYSRTLTIYNTQLTDAGEYTCSIYLEGKTDNASFVLAFTQQDGFSGVDDEKPPLYTIGIVAALLLMFLSLVFFIRKRRRFMSKKVMQEKNKNLDNKVSGHKTIQLHEQPIGYSLKLVNERRLGNTDNEASPPHQYDVFICYSSLDRNWVKNTLLKQLESRGIKACIDFRDFLVGAYIVENITEAIYGSRKTIAVLSPDFMDSVYCKHELQTALSRMALHKVIPILYKPCEVPDVLKDKTYLDWCHADVQPYFWELLEKAVIDTV